MVLAHGIGALCTFALAWVLLGAALGPLGLVAAADPADPGRGCNGEATLVVRCFSLIPVLIADGPSFTGSGPTAGLPPPMGWW